MTSAIAPANFRARRPRRRTSRDARRRNRLGYSFIFIPLGYIFAVLLAPIFYDGWVSFTNWNLTTGVPAKFIGFSNYINIFTNSAYSQVVIRSLIFTFFCVLFQVCGGIAVAMFVWRRYRNSRVLRMLLLLPMLVSEVVVGNIWRLMFNYNGGLINGILAIFHISPVFWLGPTWAFPSIIVADVWQQLPFVFLVVFAALQSVPDEILEASEIDGAHGWRSFQGVIFPLIRPAVLLVLLFETLYALREFSTVWILTEGGPAGATNLIGIDIEQVALQDFDVGMSAALSWVLLIISLIIAILYIRWLKRDPLS